MYNLRLRNKHYQISFTFISQNQLYPEFANDFFVFLYSFTNFLCIPKHLVLLIFLTLYKLTFIV